MNPIASNWQKLASMDQHSPGFLPLLSSLITGPGNIPTTELRDKSARAALDALDRVSCPLVVSMKR